MGPIVGPTPAVDQLGAARLTAMSKVLDALDDKLTAWIGEQPVFFVATAPDGPEGHINLSPKGYDSFRVLDPLRVAYLDLTGSGAETISHLRQNGRLTIMFCAFAGPPQIIRLYGTGRPVFPGDEGWEELASHFDLLPGARAIITLDIERLSSTCGYAVPFLEVVGERPTLQQWAARKDDAELVDYRAQKNEVSIDGLPAYPTLDESKTAP
jgi:hypothetical protein